MPNPGLNRKLFSASSAVSNSAEPELSAWVTRVQAAGSNVTISGTQTAVGAFIIGLKNDGVWDKIVRMNIYAGDDSLALLAPLKNGGPVSTDDFNGRVFGTYSQATGFTGNSNAYCITGMNWNDTTGGMSDTDFHVSIYTRTLNTAGKITCQSYGPPATGLVIRYDGNAYWQINDDAYTSLEPDSDGIGHYVGTVLPKLNLYKNGSSVDSDATSIGARLSRPIWFHTQHFTPPGVSNAPSNATFELYSIGKGLTATDVSNFYTRYGTLRTALGR